MAQSGGFLVWISQYGAFVQFFAQIAFWLVIGACAVCATCTFRSLVKTRNEAEKVTMEYYASLDELIDGEVDDVAEEKTEEVDVEKFVD